MRLVPLSIALLILLAGCNTPGPGFRGVSATQITVQGSDFDVRINGDRAEAIRVNTQYAPRVGPIGARAQVAIEAVSGCKVRKMGGDQAQIVATLSCKGRSLRSPPFGAPDYSCWPVGPFTPPHSGHRRRIPTEIECRSV